VKDHRSQKAWNERNGQRKCLVEVSDFRSFGEPNLRIDVAFVNQATADSLLKDGLNSRVNILVDISRVEPRITPDLDTDGSNFQSRKTKGRDEPEVVAQKRSISIADIGVRMNLFRGRVDCETANANANATSRCPKL